MRMLDLFSGIGGFALAAEWVWGDELDITGFCEIEKYAQKVLQKNFPGVPIYDDITKLNGKDFKNIDLITGGFPCPAFSMAGKRGGFDQDDLFFEMIRICSECKPRTIIFENVEGFKRWRKELQKEVENIGYDWGDAIFDARDFGIPQSRRRYFAVCIRRGVSNNKNNMGWIRRQTKNLYGIFPDTNNTERRWSPSIHTKQEWQDIYDRTSISRENHGIPSRVDRLKGLGNAIVPQVAALIMERIKNAQ
jgi:DNA (cytosine-5)-methyltransferase 1